MVISWHASVASEKYDLLFSKPEGNFPKND